jgi:ribosomal protein S18 acetylase RimI-like enzyme
MNATLTRSMISLAEARRLEEYALNASGILQTLIYDGWLIGYRPGSTKRLRCVNAFYPSTLPIPQKIEHCRRLYREAGLPPLFRLLPFSYPVDLDQHLERAGWFAFERTLVMQTDLTLLRMPPLPAFTVELLPVPQWIELTAQLRDLAEENKTNVLERARTYPLPQVGAVIRREDDVVACGLVKLEDDVAGVFALATRPDLRGLGMGRTVIAALLAEAHRRGARRAYLQVSASNDSALALYTHFGFMSAYEYWYRGIE